MLCFVCVYVVCVCVCMVWNDDVDDASAQSAFQTRPGKKLSHSHFSHARIIVHVYVIVVMSTYGFFSLDSSREWLAPSTSNHHSRSHIIANTHTQRSQHWIDENREQGEKSNGKRACYGTRIPNAQNNMYIQVDSGIMEWFVENCVYTAYIRLR